VLALPRAALLALRFSPSLPLLLAPARLYYQYQPASNTSTASTTSTASAASTALLLAPPLLHGLLYIGYCLLAIVYGLLSIAYALQSLHCLFKRPCKQ
jgi:hypothetical protein